MKISPKSDFPVRVRPRSLEEDPAVAPLYEGVFDVSLNGVVDLTFVPDISQIGPPFLDARLPRNLDMISEERDARLAAVLFGRYVVTSNEKRNDTVEQFHRALDSSHADTGVIFYVSPSRFAEFASNLDELSHSLGALHPAATISAFRGMAVIEYIESTVLASDLLRPEDAAMLR